jgi:UPF0176 protein
MTWKVAAFYRFTPLSGLPALRARVKDICAAHDLCGTILLAPEGVNATVAAAPASLDKALDALDALTGLKRGELKYSAAADRPFRRMKVRLKKEIITLRAPEADATALAGTYVSPAEWNALLADPDVLLLDTRNIYEVEAGTFRNAVDPRIATFTGFKDFVRDNLDPARHKKVAMFCTGGIRCEKASAYMRAHGFENVYHLKGGILQYLENVAPEDSLWQGSCFVFDEREGLGHGLCEMKPDAQNA